MQKYLYIAAKGAIQHCLHWNIHQLTSEICFTTFGFLFYLYSDI